jgi:phage terminase small subunit
MASPKRNKTLVLTTEKGDSSEVVELTEKQKRFCEEYIKDFNGTQSMIRAGFSQKSAGPMAGEYLKKPQVLSYIKYLQANLAEITGITKHRILMEHATIAFSSIAHLHETWIERKEFEKLTQEQKSCIAEIVTQTRTEKNPKFDLTISKKGAALVKKEIEVEYVKIRLYDKQKALDSISRMLGYDAPTKIENLNPTAPAQALQINVYNVGPPLASTESKIVK